MFQKGWNPMGDTAGSRHKNTFRPYFDIFIHVFNILTLWLK